jgi:hypothetical protein
MHTNSINAWRECQELFSNRELMILNFLEVHKTEEFTDREIMCRLGFSDPNAVRPRITGLISGTPKHDGGFVEEAGNIVCPITNKTVRIVKVAAPKPNLQTILEL